jgi:hypothetical protein
MPRRTILILVAALGGGLIFLRACVPQLWGPALPAAVVRRITEAHTVCIGTDQVPIWPGEPRQAQCGSVRVKVVAEGAVPHAEADLGTSRAVCYVLTVEQPRWETMGQTRHEILTFERTSYKVATLTNGEWVIFPDQDIQDRSRWSDHSCPRLPASP